MKTDFEEYEYDGAWYGKEEVCFNGTPYDVDVQIDSDDEDDIPETAKNLLEELTDKLDGLTEKIAESILGYYNSRREELGFSDTDSKEYPEVDHAREILKTVTLIGITIPDQDDYDDTAVSFVFDCTWDKENGVGVCLIGDEIDEVGPQDIAL
ncbi:hypothetical protein SAMN02910447_02728 [Ruminococcus sp. YE71]|uniref:DUF6985 domain-containing protein n=1 Tax=unclassified Ruminococcus TaxID=2608920 RepID=UPI000887039E|nr:MULTISPECIES: hypothetical protein [unclassified Ruminococcus]SDA26878.1 hypothetical protein SAMN02910446_02714 [Ruminococcus sp. YE78]SFW44637.1 hypothetical protein SAMN02910447_02728 [Ruminococcus sp. YE71]